MGSSIQELADPVHIPGDPLRSVVIILSIGEQSINAVAVVVSSNLHDAIGILNAILGRLAIMLESFQLLNAKILNSGLQATIPLGILHDLFHIGMGQGVLLFNFVVKNIMLHFSILLVIFFFIFFALSRKSGANKSIHNFLLLFGHGIDDILNSLILSMLNRFFVLFDRFVIHRLLLFFDSFIVIAMLKIILEAIFANDIHCFVRILIAVNDNGLNSSAGISSSKNETNLADVSVDDIRTILLQLVGIDRQCTNIPMLNKGFGVHALLCLVESAISVYALVAILKKSMAKNVKRIVVLMIPYQRDDHAIIHLERTVLNHTTVRALDVILRRPATEIVLFLSHFDLRLSYVSVLKF